MRKAWGLFLIVVTLIFAAPLAAEEPYRVTGLAVPLSRYADRARMTRALVVRVVDGDTVKVEIEDPPLGLARAETLRLIGVDTPELKDRRAEVSRLAASARDFVRERLEGRHILLAFDRELRDRYGRVLAYAYLSDGTCFNLILVAEGYGFSYRKYPFFFMDEFGNAELAARYARKGLWGR